MTLPAWLALGLSALVLVRAAPSCTQMGSTVSCTFSDGAPTRPSCTIADTLSAATRGTFTVPAGISRISVLVGGGRGGGSALSLSASGQLVTAELPVTSGSRLLVFVGQSGGTGGKDPGVGGQVALSSPCGPGDARLNAAC